MSDEKLLTGPAGKELTIDGAIAPVVVAEEHLPHEAKRFLRIGMLILLVLVGGFFAWAALAPLDAGVPAAGVTIVESKRKTVAHLSGGIVKEILVRDMQFVRAGDPLVVLDETTASAQYESANKEYLLAHGDEGAAGGGAGRCEHDPLSRGADRGDEDGSGGGTADGAAARSLRGAALVPGE